MSGALVVGGEFAPGGVVSVPGALTRSFGAAGSRLQRELHPALGVFIHRPLQVEIVHKDRALLAGVQAVVESIVRDPIIGHRVTGSVL